MGINDIYGRGGFVYLKDISDIVHNKNEDINRLQPIRDSYNKPELQPQEQHIYECIIKIRTILITHPNIASIPNALVQYAISLDDLSMIEDYCEGKPVFYRDPMTKEPTTEIGWILK